MLGHLLGEIRKALRLVLIDGRLPRFVWDGLFSK